MQSDCPGLIHSWSFLKLFNHLQQFFQVIEAVYRLPKCTIPRHKQNLLLLRRLIHLLGKVVADLSGTAVTGIQESSDAKCSKQFIYRSATVRNLHQPCCSGQTVKHPVCSQNAPMARTFPFFRSCVIPCQVSKRSLRPFEPQALGKSCWSTQGKWISNRSTLGNIGKAVGVRSKKRKVQALQF